MLNTVRSTSVFALSALLAVALLAVFSGEAVAQGIQGIAAVVSNEITAIAWNDQNCNGIREEGDSGIPGVLVSLYIVLCDGSSSQVGTQTTGDDGTCVFSGLDAGQYYLVFGLPNGYCGFTYGADSSGRTPTISLGCGQCVTICVGLCICDGEPPGCGTPGYWGRHPEAWPVENITIGGVTYSKAEAIDIINMPGKGDKTYDMFAMLVAAKLNMLEGNPTGCIVAIDTTEYTMAEIIGLADDWMEDNPLGSGVKGTDWQAGMPSGSDLHGALDDYNNGETPCAGKK
jgi:hypothetical protein